MTPVTEAALSVISSIVLWSTFALAFVFGAVAQRTGYCTMGAVADIVSFGDATRLRVGLLAMAVAIAGTQALAAWGLIDTGQSIYTGPRLTLLAYLVGGLMFGFGMVLAGGCGSRTLVRLGGGNLKSLVVFVVLGVTAFVTLRGVLAVFRVNVIEPVGVQLGARQDLPALLAQAGGVSLPAAHLLAGAVVAAALLAYVLRDAAFRTRENLLAGAAIGAVIAGVWYVSGHIGFIEEHPRTLEPTFVATASGRMESLTFVAPAAHTLDLLMFWSDASKLLTLGVAGVLGIVAGSSVASIAAGRFRWEGFRDTEDTANHIAGGLLMGFGGVTALGCTIGQGLSGVSTLSIGSFIAIAAIAAGAVFGVKWQAWRVGRNDK